MVGYRVIHMHSVEKEPILVNNYISSALVLILANESVLFLFFGEL